MFNITDIIYEKSDVQIIRCVSADFNDFNIDKTEIFRDLIARYLCIKDASFFEEHTCKMETGLDFLHNHLLSKGIRIYDEIQPLIAINCYLQWRPSKIIRFQVSVPKGQCTIDDKHIKQCIIKIVRKIKGDLKDLLTAVNEAQTHKSTFQQDIEVWNYDYTGYYDFGPIKIDFGKSDPDRLEEKTARCWIDYTQYRILLPGEPVYSFISRASKYYLLLLQSLLRFPIFKSTLRLPYIPSKQLGEKTCVKRTDFNLDYLTDSMTPRIIPNDIPDLIEKFDKLSEDKKNAYFNAANAYCEGMKGIGVKSLAYYVITLETITCFEAHKKGLKDTSKVSLIYDYLAQKFPQTKVMHSWVEKMYSIRSAYVHNGIANNDFLDEVFLKEVINQQQCKLMERIANFTLVMWLEEL